MWRTQKMGTHFSRQPRTFWVPISLKKEKTEPGEKKKQKAST